MFKVILREPLVHFLIIGLTMFVVFSLVGRPTEDTGKKIEITKPVLNTLVSAWEKQWNRPPTATELQGLIDRTVHEEIFYREAIQMGLDIDDSVVRRRLAQKLEFLIQDISAPASPTDQNLQSYLDSHRDVFQQPARYSFNQVYLNPDRRGAKLLDDARQLLIQLKDLPSVQDPAVLGDRLMLETHYREISEHQLDRLFGKGFASQLDNLPAGIWSGPVESGYGLHLVYLEAIVPARTPALDEVRQSVEQEWLATMQKEANEQVYQRLRDQYQVVIEDWKPPLTNPVTGG
jgi:hypothetical protein